MESKTKSVRKPTQETSPRIITTLRLDLGSVEEGVDDVLHGMMRAQRSALRMMYNRLRDTGEDSSKAYQQVRGVLVHLDSYEACSVRAEAMGLLRSQHELLPLHRDQVKEKVKKAEERLARNTVRVKRFEKQMKRWQDENHSAEKVQALAKKIGWYQQGIRSTTQRIKELNDKLAEIERHIKEGTVPAAVFGGKGLQRKTERRVLSIKRQYPGEAQSVVRERLLLEARQVWRDARSAQFFHSGDASCAEGNRRFRLTRSNGTLRVGIKINGGWLDFPARYSHNREKLVGEFLRPFSRKSFRLIRTAPGQFEVMVTADEPVTGRELKYQNQPIQSEKVAGVDLNLDHLALAITDREGHLVKFRVMRYAGLGELRRNKSEPRIGRLVKRAVRWLRKQNVGALVLEDLHIDPPPDGSAALNRRVVTFSHRQIHDGLTRACLRCGIDTKLVNPAYTSFMGETKYAHHLGISVHLAAALVIARRGLGFHEALSKAMINTFPQAADHERQAAQKIRQSKSDDKSKHKAAAALARKHELRAAHFTNWKQFSPLNGRPWLLWSDFRAFSQSLPRPGQAHGRTFPGSLADTGGNTSPVSPSSNPGGSDGFSVPRSEPIRFSQVAGPHGPDVDPASAGWVVSGFP